MQILGTDIDYKRLSTPQTAAIAGILFSLLSATSLILLRSSIPERLYEDMEWVAGGSGRISIVLFLMLFAGIAFLWFIGVVRDRFGKYEDQFFSTVFLCSGLLFPAMIFVSMAIVRGLIVGYQLNPAIIIDSKTIYFGRALMFQQSNIYALRMAGVFMLSLDTIWLITGLMPRWMVLLAFLLAGSLFFITSLSLWVTLIFPVWVMMISIETLSLKNKQVSPMERL